jgi:hypothetical protein
MIDAGQINEWIYISTPPCTFMVCTERDLAFESQTIKLVACSVVTVLSQLCLMEFQNYCTECLFLPPVS